MLKGASPTSGGKTSSGSATPAFAIRKIALVSRNYCRAFENGFKDFSQVLPAVLKQVDDQGCDTVLFSLYSILPRPGLNIANILKASNARKKLFPRGQGRPGQVWIAKGHSGIGLRRPQPDPRPDAAV
jgi:hypothetical protein